MRKQITLFEFIRLFITLLVGYVCHFILLLLIRSYVDLPDDLVGLFVTHVTTSLVPPFLAILVATSLPSWRYKSVAASIMLIGVTVTSFVNILVAVPDLVIVGYLLIVFSLSLSGALAAVMLWDAIRQKHEEKYAYISSSIEPAKEQPKVSLFLLILSLISIPFTYVTLFAASFLVAGYSVLLIILLLFLPWIPMVVLFAIGIAPLAAVGASLLALKAIVFPPPLNQMSVILDMSKHQRLDRIIRDVCDSVQTNLPKNVLLHAEATFFVTQQKLRTFDGTCRGRTLAIGMPLLTQLSEAELKSILAHEFAHFSGRDTLYSVWVSQCYRGIGESIVHLRSIGIEGSGLASLIVRFLLYPSVLFQITFFKYFASIDAIISRTRELRADWIAAQCYGRSAFTSALETVVAYSSYFDEHFVETEYDSAFSIFEQHHTAALNSEDERQLYLAKALDAVEHELDSHPTLSMRLANLPDTTSRFDSDSDGYLGELKEDEMRLSESVREVLQQAQE